MPNAGLDRQDAGWPRVYPSQDDGGGMDTDRVGGDGKGREEREAAGEEEEEDDEDEDEDEDEREAEEEEEPCSS
jgi:hypothetical protein